MEITFESLWPLLLLLAIPFVWWVRRSTRIDLSARQVSISTGIRSAIVCLMVLALTQPTLRRAESHVSVVYALDVSHSVAPSAVEEAIEWIRQTNASAHPSHSAYVAFAANARTFSSLEDLRNAPASIDAIAPGVIRQGGTNLAGALEQAERSLDPHELKRIVLLSDGNGNGNSGALAPALSRLRAERARVFTRPMEVRAAHDVWVEAVKAPPTVTAEEQFPLEVHVYSQAPMDAVVEVRDGAKTLGKRSTHLNPGMNRIAFETRVPDPRGPVALEAVVEPAEDTFAANNSLREPLTVNPQPRVLYVEGHAASARYLREALALEGFLVDIAGPGNLPQNPAVLDRYDLVILSDVEGKLFSPGQMQALASYVRELGGGLILACGENIYGQGGYTKTPVEAALPVTFDVSRKKPPTVAMVVVMDNSGSMNGGKIELAKLAARAPLELLRDTDRFGVMSFNTFFTWVSPLAPVTNRNAISTAISSVGAGGGTDGYPAMDAAFQALNAVPDEIKTILFLTDGRTQLRDYKTLTTKMTQAGIHVTTVAIGAGADRELLADISMWGKGRAYYVESATNVPQIFVRETELAMDKALHEAPFNLLVRKPVEAFKGINFKAAPNLLGYVATKPKSTSEILLSESIAGDPVLARWQYGLGKTALFASDVKDRWAVNWLQWDGYPKFWAQLARETMRRRNSEFDLRVRRAGDHAAVTVSAIGRDGLFRNTLDIKARMFGPDRRVTAFDIPQTGPGNYETRVDLDHAGPYTFGAGDPGTELSQAAPDSYPEEFHFYPVDFETLESVSHETGGRFEPSPTDIMDTGGETIKAPHALWPWLASMALIAFLVDLLLRRLRLFDAKS
ncbi:MAG TPA: VWA domain-containing protein [Terriglobia bacterium]|nr:VWA domain-containing protein [Terriglobia bacterium]